MRIGLVTTWFERGAAYVSRQYKEQLEQHHDVFIYARGGERYARRDPRWDSDAVTWDRSPAGPVETAVSLRDFEAWIRRCQLELVFFNEQRWWQPVLLCNRLGVTTGSYIDYYTEETIPLFRSYDFLICNTRRHLEAFSWHPGAHYVQWGTDLALFRPPAHRSAAHGPLTFFHSAGMNPRRKGCDLLLEAFCGLGGDARLIIHTQKSLGELLPTQRKTLVALEKRGQLEVHEATVPAPGLYHLGDVYVYPSRLDGVGLTIVEALASGLPVITTDCPPMNEFVSESNGRLVPVERVFARADGYYWPQCEASIVGVRNSMQFYIERTADIASFKQEARRSAEEKFDWRRNAAKVASVFETARRLSGPEREAALRAAERFDSTRWGAWGMLYRRSPSTASLAWRGRRCIGRIVQKGAQ